MENNLKVLDDVQGEIDKAHHEIANIEAHCIRQPKQTNVLTK